MFAVFGKSRPEEEKRRRLVYNKEDSTWYEDQRKWKRLSNSRYQISPEYSTIETAEEFITPEPLRGRHQKSEETKSKQ